LRLQLCFDNRRIEDTEEKEDRHLHFLINYVQEEKNKFFKHQKGVQRTYVTVANQSTVHGTNPNKRKRNTSVASPRNKSFRTNTFVRRQQTTIIFLKLFCLIGKHNWSESISFSPNQILQTPTVFTEPPTKKYLHFANFQKAGQPLKEVSLDRQNSK